MPLSLEQRLKGSRDLGIGFILGGNVEAIKVPTLISSEAVAAILAWHDAKFSNVAASYKNARAADKNATAAKAAASADPAEVSPVAEHAALPVPAYQLDMWIAAAETAMSDHASLNTTLRDLQQTLASLPPPPPSPRRSSNRSAPKAAAKRRKVTDPHSDQRKALETARI